MFPTAHGVVSQGGAGGGGGGDLPENATDFSEQLTSPPIDWTGRWTTTGVHYGIIGLPAAGPSTEFISDVPDAPPADWTARWATSNVTYVIGEEA